MAELGFNMRHIPVLLNEVIDSLQLKPGINIIDCTWAMPDTAKRFWIKQLRMGVCSAWMPMWKRCLRAKRNLYRYEGRVTFVHDNFLI